MPRLSRLVLLVGLALLVQGCQLSLPGGGGNGSDQVTPNAVTGGEIEVTALDDGATGAPAPATDGAAAGAAAPEALPEALPTAVPQGETPVAGTAEATPAPEPAPQPELAVEEPGTPKSAQQEACEKKRGKWVRVGTGTLRTCVFETRDSGKRCTRESQCEGVCLARSGTCSPLKPLLGCNEILQDNGARVTLCIE
jgi:hypothetical protein